MIHLHQLLELPEEKLYIPEHWNEHHARQTHRNFCDVAKHAVCFDVGEVENFKDTRIMKDVVVLPYKRCWFEFNLNWGTVHALDAALAYQGEDRTFVFWYRRESGHRGELCHLNGKWRMSGFMGLDHIRENHIILSLGEIQTAKYIHNVLRSFLTAMNCANVSSEEHHPPKKLQTARKRRGKQPLFSYWTLHLNGRRERGEDCGGTHASPRVHLRRAHYRWVRGERYLVQEHLVGNKKLGMVHKDYKAGPNLGASLRSGDSRNSEKHHD